MKHRWAELNRQEKNALIGEQFFIPKTFVAHFEGTAAIVLCVLIEASRESPNEGGWFAEPTKRLAEFGFSEKQVRDSKSLLKKHGLLASRDINGDYYEYRLDYGAVLVLAGSQW